MIIEINSKGKLIDSVRLSLIAFRTCLVVGLFFSSFFFDSLIEETKVHFSSSLALFCFSSEQSERCRKPTRHSYHWFRHWQSETSKWTSIPHSIHRLISRVQWVQEIDVLRFKIDTRHVFHATTKRREKKRTPTTRFVMHARLTISWITMTISILFRQMRAYSCRERDNRGMMNDDVSVIVFYIKQTSMKMCSGTFFIKKRRRSASSIFLLSIIYRPRFSPNEIPLCVFSFLF